MEFVLDAYAARSCPVKTHNAFHPGMRLSAEDESLREAFHGGIAFQQQVLADLVARCADQVLDLRGLRDSPSTDQERATLDALSAGVPVIVGGLLPRDWDGHRSGRPDLLIRGEDGYHPVQVKFQRLVEARGGEAVLTYSTFDQPMVQQTEAGFRFRWSWRLNAALQMAHYWRMLEALGRAATQPWAGLIGTDDLPDRGHVITWIHLGEASAAAPPSAAPGVDEPALVSALERYDHEFALREGIAVTAAAQGPDDPPVLRPIVNRECTYCHWFSVCRPQLDDDDLSLRINKSRLDVQEIAMLRELGVETVGALAKVDLDHLLPRYLPLVTHRAGSEERLRLAWRRSVLMAKGIDFDRLTTGPIDLPAAPLEIDIDVETSADDRVYLWGFLISDTQTGESRYRHFSGFADLDDTAEQALAVSAMEWLRSVVEGAEALVFHYSDYEVLRIDRLAKASGHPSLAWAADYARTHFVDLFAPIREHFFGTQGLGLKAVASRAAGFTWRDEAPGGLNSQAWFAEAVHSDDAEARARAATRVLEYNEDDVRATWHVRRWLRTSS